MTAAVFGLLGVLVGGVLNAFLQWRLDASRRVADGRGAVRLVAEEISGNLTLAAAAIGEDRSNPMTRMEADAWIEHKSALALTADDRTWALLREAYAAVWILKELSSPSETTERLTDALISITRNAGETLVQALEALEPTHDQHMMIEWLRGPVGEQASLFHTDVT